MPTTSPTTPTESLARLVRQKRRLLEQLVALGRRQGELIAAGDAAALLQVLGGKQQLITGLQVIERGLDAFRHEDPESRCWPSETDRAACKADADACNGLLAEVISIDQLHEGELTARRDEVGKRLQQAQSAHAASTAYKPHLRGAPRPAITVNDNAAPLSASIDLTSG
ncbi:FlgN protein [Botrimarina colliarenosi]|uniref:FlgN protein n=1 Tax=Botrimarina colliarenosi TaxID=2528001 RepID=A0A5C6AM40_9BACT|nr:flagellar export chaperone FlgN [Botrimarina colliarenosi]TWU00339.1 FlgN protein [Botrimarina colliarenosi]